MVLEVKDGKVGKVTGNATATQQDQRLMQVQGNG
jgi:hypothetical protein